MVRRIAELDRLLAVEVDVESRKPIDLPDSLAYRGSLPFEYEYFAEEGTDRFEMRVGESGSILTCHVLSDEAELGATAARLVALGGEVIEERAGPFPRRGISHLIAGAKGRHAYHGIAWLWSSDRGFAQPKAVVGNSAGLGVACVGLSLGYRQTMIDTLTHLMASLERPDPPREPYFEEIALTEIDGTRVGISRLSMFLDAEGDTEIQMDQSSLIPTGSDAVMVSYSWTKSWSRPDGSLINARTYDTDQQGVTTDLALRMEEGAWRVSGKFEGKEIDRVLEHREAIDSSRAEYLAFSRRLKPHGDTETVTLTQWLPATDPTRAFDAKETVA